MLSDRLRGVLKQYGPEVTFQVAQIALSDCVYLPEIELHDLLVIAAAESGVQVAAAMRALRGEKSLDINASVREDLAVAEYRRRLAMVVEEHLSAGTWHGWFVGPGPEEIPEESLASDDAYARWEREHPRTLNPGVLRQNTAVCALVPWIARVVHRWRKAHPAPQEKHVSELYRLGEDIIEIADWARATRPDLMPLTILQVRRRTRAWHKSKVVEAELALRPESPVVLENELYRVLRLETRDALEHEGRVMRHCVGDYWQAVVEGKRTRIYAVVEKATGKSLATVETTEKRPWNEKLLTGGRFAYGVRQVRGFANARVTNVGVRATLATLYQQEGIQKERKSDATLDGLALAMLGASGASVVGGIVADMVDRYVATKLDGLPDHGPPPKELAERILGPREPRALPGDVLGEYGPEGGKSFAERILGPPAPKALPGAPR
jgi:hypothetical protein